MKDEAEINDLSKQTKNIELLFNGETWEDVLNLAGDVMPQLEKLAKQSGQPRRDICNMLEKVKLTSL